MGQLTVQSTRHAFALYAQQANAYVKARCVLVGDAAHTLHPLAGQGVNLGIADVACLVELLQKELRSGRQFGATATLLAYQRRRRVHNQIMIHAMDAFKRGFGSRHAVIRGLRNTGLNWVDEQKGIKQIFARLAQGV
jgi:2-polyprenylphenol 6-hydroxylase